MRRARRPRLLGATTKAMPVSIVLGAKRRVMKQSGDLRGPDRTRARARVGDRAPAPPAPPGPRHSACGADRGQAGGLAGQCATSCAGTFSGPPADVVVFMNTGT